MKEFLYIIIGVAFILILYFGICYRYFKQLFFHFNDVDMHLVNPDDDFYIDAYTWYDGIPKEDVHIKSYDDLKLHGIYIPSHNKKTEKLAIVIHGYQSKAYDMVIIAKMYSDLGFKVLMIDQRGHGESEGKFTSVGFYESFDLKKWLHYATRTYGSNIQILLHGVSMGASTAVLATEYPEIKHVKMMVLDSLFTNFSSSIYRQVKKLYLRLFVPGVSLISFFRLKFFLRQVHPLKHIKRCDIPTLFIHSGNDGVVSKEMVESLYKHLKTDRKEMLHIEGARHAKGFEVDKDLYIQSVIDMTSDVFKIKKSDIKYMK